MQAACPRAPSLNPNTPATGQLLSLVEVRHVLRPSPGTHLKQQLQARSCQPLATTFTVLLPAGSTLRALPRDETSEQALERRVRESREVEERIREIYSKEDFVKELQQVNQLVLLAVQQAQQAQT